MLIFWISSSALAETNPSARPPGAAGAAEAPDKLILQQAAAAMTPS